MKSRKTKAFFVYNTGVCEKETPPEKKTLGQIGSQSTDSGAGAQFMLLGCGAKAPKQGVFLIDTGTKGNRR